MCLYQNRTGRRRNSLEGTCTKAKDTIQLEKRLGLFSGVALIVGTMIGKSVRRIDMKLSLICLFTSILIKKDLEFLCRQVDYLSEQAQLA